MSDSQRLVLPFLYNPAQHNRDSSRFSEVWLTLDGEPIARNAAQANALDKVGLTIQGALEGTDPLRDQGSWYTVDATAQGLLGINGEQIFRERLFLFNIIISFEWLPSAQTQQQIRIAAQKASDFLFDVTDGYMAIGQAIIGGSELLDASDIQVLASNRLYPRSWVNGLHKPEKFQPIRLGRGTWQKNRGILLTWDTPEGYRALVHEWGHYAFGMVDRYLKKRPYARDRQDQYVWDDTKLGNKIIAVAVPEIALSVETIMANQEISEFAPDDDVFGRITENFKRPVQKSALEGPDQLPLSLPIFPEPRATASPNFTQVRPSNKVSEEIVLPMKEFIDKLRPNPAPQAPTQTNPEARLFDASLRRDAAKNHSHWMYVLKKPFTDGDIPARIIAQGKLSSQDETDGFVLLGAEEGDRVVIVSEVGGYTQVHYKTLELPTDNQQSESRPSLWLPATPPSFVSPPQGSEPAVDHPFFVDVIPKSLGDIDSQQTPPLVEVRVGVTAEDLPDDIYIYTSSQPNRHEIQWAKPVDGATAGALALSEYKMVPQLDGHVFLRWRGQSGDQNTFFICSYSQGGGPLTTAGGKPSITAGSSEGNAMLFFLGPGVQGETDDTVPQDNPKVRIVTSMLPALQPFSKEAGIESRSYIFSLASNESLHEYTATLVLYYDDGAPKYGGGLYIYRWDEASSLWQRLTTIAPTDLAYIALPITSDLETAPGLMSNAEPRVERYRICWKRRS